MSRSEIRYRVVAALLQAGGAVALSELCDRCELAQEHMLPVLNELTAESRVIEGQLIPGTTGPQYCWAAIWEREAKHQTMRSVQRLEEAVASVPRVPDHELDVESAPSRVFYDFVIHRYCPPPDKRFLVFLQCSVRRPFSSSPSHAWMRRAIVAATGCDPRHDFESCPVHVVVLASKMGPVPYELEDVYPATVRGGGVKHFGTTHFARVSPVLADRVTQYILTHQKCYIKVAAFADGRYGEVMEDARELIAERTGHSSELPIFPDPLGSRVTRCGQSTPRRYWEKYWIQLYLEIVSWLDPAQQALARDRLAELDVVYR